MTITLKFENLTFERNNQVVLSSVSHKIHAGELLQVCGANGSGKSTLLRILAGLIEPQEGSILWCDRSIYQQKEFYYQQLYYLGHQNGIKPNLTVYENIKLNYALQGLEINLPLLNCALEKMDLTKMLHIQAQNLSAGQLRRLGLIKLFLNHKPLWILDEPTTALDNQSQMIFTELLKDHLEKDGMAIVATHQSLNMNSDVQTIFL